MRRIVVNPGDPTPIKWALVLILIGAILGAFTNLLGRAAFIGAVVCGGLALGCLGLYFGSDDRVVLTPRGLRDNLGFIRWKDVISAKIFITGEQRFLCLELPGAKYAMVRRHPHADDDVSETTSWSIDLTASLQRSPDLLDILRSWIGAAFVEK